MAANGMSCNPTRGERGRISLERSRSRVRMFIALPAKLVNR